MKNLKVLEVKNDEILFENGVKLYSNHEQDCCESHYLSMDDLTIEDFEGLEFDLTSDNFFKRIEGYGIELVPIIGYSVKIPGYAENNGYYSSQLDLIITDNESFTKEYDIAECQDW
tara:strand:+ start:119 stop:466 length:348 start_codon:yes stop_codon:yes gene_type:complete